MDQGPLHEKLTGVIEADETYVGGKARGKRHTGRGITKAPIAASVQRNGIVRSQHIARVTAQNLKEFIGENVDKTSVLMTDGFKSYKVFGREYARHGIIRHDLKQYVKGDVHTNTIKGYFSILKRGINGVYQHVSRKHLQRYLQEFDFRYNTRKEDDATRTAAALSCIEGKRLMCRAPSIIA